MDLLQPTPQHDLELVAPMFPVPPLLSPLALELANPLDVVCRLGLEDLLLASVVRLLPQAVSLDSLLVVSQVVPRRASVGVVAREPDPPVSLLPQDLVLLQLLAVSSLHLASNLRVKAGDTLHQVLEGGDLKSEGVV